MTQQRGLDQLFSDAERLLPRTHDPNGDWVTLSADNVPKPPKAVTTDGLWMRDVGFHLYNDFPVPSVDLCIDKPTCRSVALLILAVLFHPEPGTVEVDSD